VATVKSDLMKGQNNTKVRLMSC